VVCGTHPSFSPNTAIEVVGLIQASVDGRLRGLLGPYHQHVIDTFNTCSRGSTHRSLTDTGGGYNLRGAGFPHTTHGPFQSMVSIFHLRDPPGLQFNQVLPIKLKFEFKEPMVATWSFDHSAIYRGLLLCLAVTNGLQLLKG
jgi:hypothetical protein